MKSVVAEVVKEQEARRLTRKRSVLDFVGTTGPEGSAYFGQPDMEKPCDVNLQFSYADWEDMGKPQQITVAIVPGDKLNAGSDDEELLVIEQNDRTDT